MLCFTIKVKFAAAATWNSAFYRQEVLETVPVTMFFPSLRRSQIVAVEYDFLLEKRRKPRTAGHNNGNHF